MESNKYLCAYCGSALALEDEICLHCFQPVFITRAAIIKQNMEKMGGKKINFAYRNFCEDKANIQPEAYLSLGIIHLQLGSYEFAIKNLKSAVDKLYDNVDAYFYLAIALLKGKNPRKCTLSVIKNVIAYIETALNLDDQGKVYYLYGIIIENFYDVKKLRYKYTSTSMYQKAKVFQVTVEDIVELEDLCQINISK